jgi:hypothetical protein
MAELEWNKNISSSCEECLLMIKKKRIFEGENVG